MITLKDFMEITNYRITEGSEYQWHCFGSTAYRLDSWDGDQNGHTLSIVFDTKTQEVYQVEAFDYSRERAYRMTNPDYKEAFDSECQDRDVLDMAWEDDAGNPIRYVDLDVEEDFIEKAQAIVAYEDYDTRVKVPVEFTDEELLTYMKMAHDRDMTFNQFVEMALQAAIDEIKLREELDNIRPEYDFSEGVRGPVEQSVKKLKKKKGKL